jgi:hypothetical protein
LSDTNLKHLLLWNRWTKIVSGGPALWPRWLHSCT